VSVRNKPGASARTISLVILLGVAVSTYLILLPRLHKMQADTARIERETAQRTTAPKAELVPSIDAAVHAAEAAPNDAGAQVNAARALADTGRYAESEARAREALRIQPANVDAAILVGDIRRRLKDYFGAIEAYRATLKRVPDDPRATAALASLYITLGWTQDATRLLQSTLKKNQANLPLKVALSMVYVQHGDPALAESLLREVKSAAPDRTALWSPVVPVSIELHHYADAIAVAREVLARTPNDPPMRAELGRALLESGQIDEAAAELQRALNLDPQNAAVHTDLGRCYARNSKRVEAIAEYEAALRIDPTLTTAKRLLGQLYIQSGRRPEGARLVAEAEAQDEKTKLATRVGYQLSNKTGDADAHWQMAKAYHERGDIPREIVELRRTLELNPNHKPAKGALASLPHSS
jgi:tetratricopeptide (TPR) repeat protein